MQLIKPCSVYTMLDYFQIYCFTNFLWNWWPSKRCSFFFGAHHLLHVYKETRLFTLTWKPALLLQSYGCDKVSLVQYEHQHVPMQFVRVIEVPWGWPSSDPYITTLLSWKCSYKYLIYRFKNYALQCQVARLMQTQAIIWKCKKQANNLRRLRSYENLSLCC